MDRYILVGTSHCTPRWNPMKTVFEEEFNLPFSNRAVSALGIETYIPRILSIMQEYQNEKLQFILEIPTSGRFQDYITKDKCKYTPFSIISKDFWPIQKENLEMEQEGQYKNHIFYYNASKLFNEKSYDLSPKITNSLLKYIVMQDNTIRDEQKLFTCLFIDGFIKNAGHDCVWFNTNDTIIYKEKFQELMQTYNFNLLTETRMWKIIERKYKKDIYSLYRDEKVFPDGAHLNKNDWDFLIRKYFVPYFK
jgi:hypothetical protein